MTELKLTGEELTTFDAFYQRRLTEAGGARDDAEELAIARDILQAVVNDGLTPTADGGASYIRRGAMDWSDPATLQAAQATAGSSGGRKGKSRGGPGTVGGSPVMRSKELLQGLAMLAAVVAIAGWYLWPMLFGQDKAVQAKEKDGTPTPEVVEYTVEPSQKAGAATPVPTLQTELLADIVDAGGVKTGLVVPRTLEIKGVSFVVQPVTVVAGDWPLPDDPRAVSWVFGTVVNYALGLEATPENRQLLASLQAGDELLLRMSTGPAYRYAFADLIRVAPHASEIFRQNRPGLILALLGEEEQSTRIVLRAIYVPNTDPDEAVLPVTQGATLSEPVLVNETLRLTCLGSVPLTLPDTPPGYVTVGVDYVVENVLKDLPVATAPFAHQVEAGGITYPAIQTLVTRAVGKYPPLPTTLEAGGIVTTTAIYAVPQPALKTGLVWRFAPDPAGGTAVQVALPPYQGILEAEVGIQDVGLRDDGTLAVKIRVRAPALRSVEINAADIQVQGGAFSPVGNVFPWRVAMGEIEQFNLLLLPDHNAAGLTVALLEQGFELTWPK